MSNETLQKSIDDLRREVASNNEEQRATRNLLSELSATFATWQKTRCDDHHQQIIDLRAEVKDHEGQINRAIGKAAGLLIAINIGGIILSYLVLATKLSRHITEAG